MDTWEREFPSTYNEPTLTPHSGVELCERSGIRNSDLTEAEAPPLASRNFEPANENTGLPEKEVDRPKPTLTTPDAEVWTPPAANLKTVSSVGSGAVVIFGVLSFAAGVGLGAILFSKSNSNLHASLSDTANQLQSIATEVNSLRQDTKSLAGELAQIRGAQENLIAAQAESVSKSQRPDPSTSDHRGNRGRRP
jgi:uncharacterized protein HemX